MLFVFSLKFPTVGTIKVYLIDSYLIKKTTQLVQTEQFNRDDVILPVGFINLNYNVGQHVIRLSCYEREGQENLEVNAKHIMLIKKISKSLVSSLFSSM